MQDDPGLAYLAFGRLSDHTVLASHCALADEEQARQIEDIFRRLLEASRQKLASGQRQRLQWNAGSVCCLVDQDGICLYALVTKSVNYPEKFAFNLLQELSQDVEKQHGSQIMSAGPYSLNLKMKPRMEELLQQYEDPKLRNVTDRVRDINAMMQDNVRRALQDGNTLDELQDKSERMASSAQTFAGRSHELRRRNMRRNLMLGALIFGVVMLFYLAFFRGGGPPPAPDPPDVPDQGEPESFNHMSTSPAYASTSNALLT
jgi:hypothetical protein